MTTETIDSVDETLGGESGIETTATERRGSGLDENVAGALSYLLGFITGIVFYFVDSDREFVRFHAAQSIVFSAAVFVASIVLSILGALVPLLFLGDAFVTGGIVASLVGLLFGLVSLVLSLGVFALWVFLMVRAYQGKRTRIPVVAGIADRLV